MGWHVEINVTYVAADGQFTDFPGINTDSHLKFGTLKEVVAFLKGVGRLAGKDAFAKYVEAVRREGRMMRRTVQAMLAKCIPEVSAAINHKLDELRRRGLKVVRRTSAE